jgi:CheY-like chemotaxis protein
MPYKSEPVLIVEDSQEDYAALNRSFSKVGILNPLKHCSDGDEALDYMYQRAGYEDPGSAPRPALILLDLNLPGTDGREILRQLKQDDQLKEIPIIVLTTSTDPRDITQCYRLGANSYVTKPTDPTRVTEIAQQLKEFWLGSCSLPTDAEPCLHRAC